MALVTLQTILQDAFPAYEQTHLLPAHVRKAARAIMQCRIAALGGHIQACPAGHVTRVWYNACRHRACPQCTYLQTERWLALQQARLLACDHYHVIFTLPHCAQPALAGQCPRDAYGALSGGVGHAAHLAGGLAVSRRAAWIIAALHPWSQTLVLPPHLQAGPWRRSQAGGDLGRGAPRLSGAQCGW